MDNGVGNQLPDGQFGEHRHLLAQGLADHLIAGQQVGDETDQPFKTGGVPLAPLLLADGLDPAGPLVEDNPHRLRRRG